MPGGSSGRGGPVGAHSSSPPPSGGKGKHSAKKAGLRADDYGAQARLLSVQNGRPQRHPARLVGDAVDILGRAQETIRGKACRTIIRKARSSLIEMLEGGLHAHPTGGAACGRHGRRQKKRQRQRQEQRKGRERQRGRRQK